MFFCPSKRVFRWCSKKKEWISCKQRILFKWVKNKYTFEWTEEIKHYNFQWLPSICYVHFENECVVCVYSIESMQRNRWAKRKAMKISSSAEIELIYFRNAFCQWPFLVWEQCELLLCNHVRRATSLSNTKKKLKNSCLFSAKTKPNLKLVAVCLHFAMTYACVCYGPINFNVMQMHAAMCDVFLLLLGVFV